MKKFLTALIALFLFLSNVDNISAEIYMVSPSAQVGNIHIQSNIDQRATKLKEFFEKYNSPLADYSQKFVVYADKYNIDWRLVPAITGVESTFAKHMPSNSYNAYGWANGDYYFDSWDDSIETVSRTLREKYLDNGATSVNKISRIYAPPSSTWSWKVKYFMNKIDPVPVEFDF